MVSCVSHLAALDYGIISASLSYFACLNRHISTATSRYLPISHLNSQNCLAGAEVFKGSFGDFYSISYVRDSYSLGKADFSMMAIRPITESGSANSSLEHSFNTT